MLDTRQYNRDLTDLYYNSELEHRLRRVMADIQADDVKAIQFDEARSLMGGRQENWFYGQLKNASTRGAQWKVVGQQIVCESLTVNHVGRHRS